MKTRVPRGSDRRKPILIIQHAIHEHPAAVRRALESQGIVSQWIHPYQGDPYPEIAAVSGLISMGGPMGANDESEHPWIKPECTLMKKAVENGLPVVGICLGGQLLARALGGRVEKHQTAEVGWFPLKLNAAGTADPVVGVAGVCPTVYHWHGDTFYPPKQAELLAGSAACERQAYRIGENAYGFQFHPEADHQLVHEWLSIEGVEEEIVATRHRHGVENVQDADTQRKHALDGERASLKFTAAIGALFRQRTQDQVNAEIRVKLVQLASPKKKFLIDFENPDRKITRLRGHISTIFTISAGEFMMFREENSLLWPIRIEDIKKITIFD